MSRRESRLRRERNTARRKNKRLEEKRQQDLKNERQKRKRLEEKQRQNRENDRQRRKQRELLDRVKKQLRDQENQRKIDQLNNRHQQDLSNLRHQQDFSDLRHQQDLSNLRHQQDLLNMQHERDLSREKSKNLVDQLQAQLREKDSQQLISNLYLTLSILAGGGSLPVGGLPTTGPGGMPLLPAISAGGGTYRPRPSGPGGGMPIQQNLGANPNMFNGGEEVDNISLPNRKKPKNNRKPTSKKPRNKGKSKKK